MDNYIKEEGGGTRIFSMLCERAMNTDLADEVSLPDYQPEIKRLLRVRATVHPADKYVGSGSVELSGLVDYCILYSGNDGALYCTTQSGEYRFSVPVEIGADYDPEKGLVCEVEAIPDGVSGRVVAPRRLTVKCRLRSRVRVWGSRAMGDPVERKDPTVEILCGSAKCAKVFLGTGEPLALGDEILLDGTSADLRVICAEGQVFVTEASAGSGVVNCRGEVALKLLTCAEAEGSLPTQLLRRIPFSGAVPVDGAEVNCDCTASGVCTDLSVTVEEGKILCDVNVCLMARAQRNDEISFPRDAYSVEKECEGRKETVLLPIALRCVNGNFSLNESKTLEEVGIRQGHRLLDTGATATVLSMENEQGRVYLTGRCRCQLILASEEDVSAQELEFPFRYEMEGMVEESATDYSAALDVVSCRGRMDGERISVDAEIAVSAAVMGETKVEMLTDARFGEAVSRPAGAYRICFPSREDTLWSVAKRYHRPVSHISELNGLPGAPAADSRASLEGVSYLLV